MTPLGLALAFILVQITLGGVCGFISIRRGWIRERDELIVEIAEIERQLAHLRRDQVILMPRAACKTTEVPESFWVFTRDAPSV